MLNGQIWQQYLPPHVKTWIQLKGWAQQNPTLVPEVDMQNLDLLQAMHYQSRERAQQRGSGGVEIQSPSNGQEPSTPRLNRQDHLYINQFAYKLMQTGTPEIKERFEREVREWPDDKKQQLLDQRINPLFLRFRQHVEMLYKRGALNDSEAVNKVAQNDTLHQAVSNDLSGLGSESDAVENAQVEAASFDLSGFNGQGQADEAASMQFHLIPGRTPSETYPEISAANTPSPFRRGSPYIFMQDSLEQDQPTPLSRIPADGSTDGNPNTFDRDVNSSPNPAAVDNFDFNSLLLPGEVDFDSFLDAGNDYGSDSTPAPLKPQWPPTYGETPQRSPDVNNAVADFDKQEQRRQYESQLKLLEIQNKKRALLSSRERKSWETEQQPSQYNERVELRELQNKKRLPVNPQGERQERMAQQQSIPYDQQMQQGQMGATYPLPAISLQGNEQQHMGGQMNGEQMTGIQNDQSSTAMMTRLEQMLKEPRQHQNSINEMPDYTSKPATPTPVAV
ncbi:hypothetical protein J4E89_009381 [Alternaria sp. Ai002NY15]|nr:hypothetical protein J4E89_009381 [Alternaria sp. Ai002NY15]